MGAYDQLELTELEAKALELDVRVEHGSGPGGQPTREDFIAALGLHEHGRSMEAPDGAQMIPCRVMALKWSQGGIQYGRGSTVLVPDFRVAYFTDPERFTNPAIVPLTDS